MPFKPSGNEERYKKYKKLFKSNQFLELSHFGAYQK